MPVQSTSRSRLKSDRAPKKHVSLAVPYKTLRRTLSRRQWGAYQHLIFTLPALVRSVFILASLTGSAFAMSESDILFVDTLTPRLQNMSWCAPDAVIGSATVPETDSTPGSRAATEILQISRLSAQPSTSIIATYRNAKIETATCARFGEYIFVRGASGLVETQGQSVTLPTPFAHFLRNTPGASAAVLPVSSAIRNAGTAPDGSIFVQLDTNVSGVDLNAIARSEDRARARSTTLSTFRAGKLSITYFPGPSERGLTLFPIFGITGPQPGEIGTFRCSGSRAGCTPGHPSIVYFLHSRYYPARKPENSLFTVTPTQDPVQREWPITSQLREAARGLEIISVTLNDTKCFVLLQPDPRFAQNRVKGRLKLDLLIAPCSFQAGRLDFGSPQAVARKQASFISAKASIQGDLLAITEHVSPGSEEEDQAPFERAAFESPRACTRFFQTHPTFVPQPVNIICAGFGPGQATRMTVSPDARFVAIDGPTPIIVGRAHRNDDNKPTWLSQGEQQ